MVLRLLNAILIVILSVALVEAPALAAPANVPLVPLGVVLQADNAQVGVDATYSGATIYDGDRLETPRGATLRARFGAGQLVLRQSTATQVHNLPNGFSADLNTGSIIVSSGEGQTFQVVADGAIIRPANTHAASVQISKTSEKELVLTGERGTSLVTLGDEFKTVEAGNSYRMEIEGDDPSPAPSSPQTQLQPTGRNWFLWYLIPTVVIVTGIVAWRVLVSPSSTSN
jgi:hypothetical protein